MSEKITPLGAIARSILEHNDEEFLGILEGLKSNVGNSSGLTSEVLINLNGLILSELRYQIKVEKKEILRDISEEDATKLLNAPENSTFGANPKAVLLRALHRRQQMLIRAI